MSSAPPAADLPFSPVYAIFEGGGAKGITHIGALKALEEQRLAIIGVAGTSAGAIVAALVAVGYGADELLTPGGGNILSALGTDVLSVLGRREWAAFRRLRWWTGKLVWSGAVAIGLLVAALVVSAALREGSRAGAAPAGWLLAARLAAAFAAVLLVACAAAAVALLWTPVRRRGLFPSDGLRRVINEALRRKLAAHYQANGVTRQVPKRVRFSDIEPANVPQCVPLKVIASDVRGGRLVLFDRQSPAVVVADAVVASASIPFAFAPSQVEGAPADDAPVYADGGLVSNLPSWAFATEKRAFERRQGGIGVPIMAFALQDAAQAAVEAAADCQDAAPARPLGPIAYTADVLRTGIFGSQQIVGEFVSGLEVVTLPTPLDTLSFGLNQAAALAAYDSGRTAAKLYLRRRRQTALLLQALLGRLHADAVGAIGKRREAQGRPAPRLRVSLVDPSGPVEQPDAEFRVAASFGMDADADDRLLFDPRNPAAPRAYRDRKAVLAPIAGQSADQLAMSKYERELLARDLCSVVCVPVFGRPPIPGQGTAAPARILCLDSSDDLLEEFADPTFLAMLARAGEGMSPVLVEEAVK